MLAANRAFDAGNERDAALARAGERVVVGQLSIVKRDRERVKAEGKNANVRIRSYSLDAAVANTIVAAESFAR